MDFKTFRQRFKELPAQDQDFLKVLSIAYEPLNQTRIVSVLNGIGLKTERATKYNGPIVKQYFERLEGDWMVLDKKLKIRVKEDFLEWIMRLAIIDERFDLWTREIQNLLPYKEWYRPASYYGCIRELRIAMYQGKVQAIMDVLQAVKMYFPAEFSQNHFFEKFFNPFDPKWLKTFPIEIQDVALEQLTFNAIFNLDPVEDFVAFMKESEHLGHPFKGQAIRSYLNTVLLLQGKWEAAAELLAKEKNETSMLLRAGWINFLKGENALALKYFDDALKKYRKETSDRKAYFRHLGGIFHVLTILKQRGKDYLKKIHSYAENVPHSTYEHSFQYLNATAYYLKNQVEDTRFFMNRNPNHSFDLVIKGIVDYWTQHNWTTSAREVYLSFYKDAKENGYDWMAMELAGCFSKVYPDEELRNVFKEEWETYQQKLKVESILNIVEIKEKWERSLEALLQLKGTRKRKKATNGKASRLVWLIDFDRHEIQPKEQTINQSGLWSKGRNVALKRLKEGGVKCMTEQDMRVAKAVKVHSGWGYYAGTEYLDFDIAVKALVGHPLVFRMDAPGISVEILDKQPELVVEQKNGMYEVKFNEEFEGEGSYLIKETPTRYYLFEVTKTHEEINRLIEGGNLQIPEAGKDRLVEVIGNLSSVVTVQSAVGEQAADIPNVEAESRTYVHLLPIGDGFKLEFFVKPFSTEPPYFKPGSGRENVIAEINGQVLQTQRDLNKEKERAKRVEEGCPSLQKVESYNLEWQFEEVTDCLNVLLELEPFREKGQIILEHPKGEKLRITGQLDFGSLSLGIKKERDWFGLSGKVKVNEKQVIDFRQLLEMVENSNTNFVELNDGQFLALTEQLRKRVLEINSLLSKTKKELRFHPLAAPVLEDFGDLLDDIKVDAAWKKHLNKLKEAREVNPDVPSTFKAELRDYQRDGYRWLSQLAHWGVGACLADDMGLGKTIQALAILVKRAKEGPALVVAPASVTRNWLRECEKFAPTLNPVLFGNGDRKKTLEQLKPFDLLICSYGLMQTEGELLGEKPFNTIILDEAQAIKNRSTKRSKAAMGLAGNFKIITTGTPIENHLGELWNLFNFLNPGLLGSLEKFNEKYSVPIERYNDKDRRNQLRRLIQPFILRRRKNDVLDELPEKTEITLTVDLTEEERNFYEALRRNAIENIETMEEGGQKRFAILAELMKLRQACCNPRLVLTDSKVPSSKLALFAEVVQELLENGHKALIFSQFVKHLRIIEQWVQKNNISYQYLDGQTPLPKREKAINAFQGGEGDLFLISLKAGGTGLNLTAADYVLHLDPWWNPAVEDQASDRAHRIGQKRPVTIYRLVTENTIEDKIVKLHAEKRDLADSLLEGTEASAKLSSDELLDLIKGG